MTRLPGFFLSLNHYKSSVLWEKEIKKPKKAKSLWEVSGSPGRIKRKPARLQPQLPRKKRKPRTKKRNNKILKAFALYEGTYSVDQSKKFIPFDPAVHSQSDRPGSLFINVQPFLIDTGKELLLLDAGLGFTSEEGELILHRNIRDVGYDPGDVSKVLMSHLHFDHSGGMVQNRYGRYEPSFPQAEYYVQREEFEHALSKPSRSYYLPMLEAMQRSGNLVMLEGSGSIGTEIQYELTGGHSEFHQVFLLDLTGVTYFFGGDILPEPEQLQRKFIAKYDFDGRKSMQLRQEYGIKAAKEGWICLFYHSENKAKGKVRYENDAFFIDEVK